MTRKSLPFFLLVGLFVGLVSLPFLPVPTPLGKQAAALEKVKLGTPVKMNPNLYLPILAAEEKGFWKENGLEVEWFPFPGGTAQLQALVTGAINIGMGSSDSPLIGAAKGLPLVLVAMVNTTVRFNIFVRADSPYRNVRDLKGKRIGVNALNTTVDAQGRVVLAAHGMGEKDVRFVGAGGAPTMIAGLRAGAFEAMITSLFTAGALQVEGIVRDIAATDDYLPQPWVGTAIYAQKDFARSKPDIVRKEIMATFQAIDFVRKNPRWSQDKMRSFQGVSEAAAKFLYDALTYAPGKLERKAVENMRRLYIEYGLVTEKALAVDELFTNEYVP